MTKDIDSEAIGIFISVYLISAVKAGLDANLSKQELWEYFEHSWTMVETSGYRDIVKRFKDAQKQRKEETNA